MLPRKRTPRRFEHVDRVRLARREPLSDGIDGVCFPRQRFGFVATPGGGTLPVPSQPCAYGRTRVSFRAPKPAEPMAALGRQPPARPPGSSRSPGAQGGVTLERSQEDFGMVVCGPVRPLMTAVLRERASECAVGRPGAAPPALASHTRPYDCFGLKAGSGQAMEGVGAVKLPIHSGRSKPFAACDSDRAELLAP